jgi:Bacterial Ig-like domain (group 3)/Putative Ig domain
MFWAANLVKSQMLFDLIELGKCMSNFASSTWNGYADGSLVAKIAAVVLFLFFCGSTAADAQTTGIVNVPFGFSSIMQASDGNYYATYAGVTGSAKQCAQAGTTSCGGIYQIKPDGTVTEIYDFWFGIGQNPVNGSIPLNLVEGPDGYLYGTTNRGGLGTYINGAGDYGANTYGTFFKITKDGTSFTLLHSFTAAEGGVGGRIILGSDGNFYGAGVADSFPGLSSIYKLSPTGQFTLLYQFVSSDTKGASPSGLVEGTDGNFYGTTPSYYVHGAYYANGSIFQVTPSGTVTDIVTLPVDGSLGVNPSGALVEGPDGALYGTTQGASYLSASVPYATLFRATMAGALTVLYTFSSASDGIYPVASPPVAAADGNIYATAQSGGNSTVCSVYGGCGTLFSVSPNGTFTNLIQFPGGSSGAFPEALIADSSGGLIGATAGYQGSQSTVFGSLLASGTASPPPIQISFYPTNSTTATLSAPANVALILQWNVSNAFSNTMRVCSAFRQDSLDKTWTGVQTGIASAAGFGGSATITTPATAGVYTYVLTCGGVENGFAKLSVGGNLQIDSTALPIGTVSQAYSYPLLAHGGTPPYSWELLSTPPPGVAIDPASGIIDGTPQQYGVYQVTAAAFDSSTPQYLKASVTLQLIVNSGLILQSSLPNAVVGDAYAQTDAAIGGLPPYKWQLTSGQLPAGLTLNTSTGVVFGTPTKAGQSTFAITLSDNEGTSAIVTQTYTLSTVVPPLMVSDVMFPTCTVAIPCNAQVHATGGTPPYTWALASGSTLPPGLTMDSTGAISGAPVQFEFYVFEIQATDTETPPATASGTFSITINSGLTETIQSPLPDAVVGLSYAAPVPVVTGGLPPYKLIAQSSTTATQEFGFVNGVLTGTPSTPTPQGLPYAIHYTVYDSEVTPATYSVTAELTVLPAPMVTTTSLTSSSSIAGIGMPVIFTAHVGGAIPTGVVNFFSGTNALGRSIVDANGNAALTTSFTANGVYSITASYDGDSANAASVSPALTQTIVTPSILGSISPGTLTVHSGSSGTLFLTLTPVGGYTGNVSFSCGVLPAHVSCTFAPPSLTLTAGSGPVTDTLTVNTEASSAAAHSPATPWNAGPTSFALVLCMPGSLLVLLGICRKSPFRTARNTCLLGTVLLMLAAADAISGCGSASNNATPGTYSVPIVLTLSGGATQQISATVIVQ